MTEGAIDTRRRRHDDLAPARRDVGAAWDHPRPRTSTWITAIPAAIAPATANVA